MNRNWRIPLLGRFFIGTGRLINLLLWWLILFVVVRGLLYLSPDLNQTRFAHYVSLVVEPATSQLEELFKNVGIKPVIRETNILLPSLFLLLLSIRSLLKRGVNKLELYLTSRSITTSTGHRGKAPDVEPPSEAEREAAERQVALKRYNEARRLLESTHLKLTFLSLDVVDSTGLKKDQDRYGVEQTFSDYRDLVERHLKDHDVYKATWTPDGQMAAFRTAQKAVECAKNLLGELDHFNENRSTIDGRFEVRVGVNTGEVSTDDATPMVEISDFSVDLAGHLQKYARPNTIWASEETYNNLEDKTGFKKIDETVDDRIVYEWAPEDE